MTHDSSWPLALTVGGTGGTVLFAGLQISEICVIISCVASVCGVALQFWLAWRRRGEK